MLDSLKNSLGWLLKKPVLLLPAIVVGAINAALIALTYDAWIDFIYGVEVLEMVPQGVSVLQYPLFLYQLYAPQLNVIFLVLFVSAVLNFLLVFLYSRFAKENDLGKAFSYALGRVREIISIIIFTAAIFSIAGIGFALLYWLGSLSTLLFALLAVVFMLLGAYLGTRFVFTIPSMAIKKINLRKGLIASWQFSKKKVLSVLVLLIVVFIVTSIIGGIETGINGNIEGIFLDQLYEGDGNTLIDWAMLGIGIVFEAIAVAFSSLMIALYYIKHQKK